MKEVPTESKAVLFFATRIVRGVFDTLVHRRAKNLILREKRAKVEELAKKNMKRRAILDMIECYAIQPKLDQIADSYFIGKSLRLFKQKVFYIRDRNNGQNLHEFEVKAYKWLGENLLRKAFSGIRLIAQ